LDADCAGKITVLLLVIVLWLKVIWFTWMNKKQSVVVRSSVEAKYIAMARTTRELARIQFLREMGFFFFL